jgi:hypothetical protein
MIKVKGEIVISGTFNTVGDMREFMNQLDKYQVSDSVEMLDGYAGLVISGRMEPIQCGEHLVEEGDIYDVLLITHEHDNDGMFEELGYSESKKEGKV